MKVEKYILTAVYREKLFERNSAILLLEKMYSVWYAEKKKRRRNEKWHLNTYYYVRKQCISKCGLKKMKWKRESLTTCSKRRRSTSMTMKRSLSSYSFSVWRNVKAENTYERKYPSNSPRREEEAIPCCNASMWSLGPLQKAVKAFLSPEEKATGSMWLFSLWSYLEEESHLYRKLYRENTVKLYCESLPG